MKSISTFVNESLMSPNEQEMIKDYEILDGADMNTKKKLASKYGIDSKKAKEIQQVIILKMRDIRKKKHQFNTEDIKWFYRLEIPSRYNKAVDFYKEESIDFIEYLKNNEEKKLKERKIFGRSSKDKYGLSMSDKWMLSRYENYVQFLSENDPKEISSKASKENIMQAIKLRLTDCMKDFHDEYIEKVRKHADKYYDNLPEAIENAKTKMNQSKKTYYDTDRKACDLHNSGETRKDHDKKKEYEKLSYLAQKYKKVYEKNNRIYNQFSNVLKKFTTKKSYVDTAVEEGENIYDMKVTEIADRVKEHGFNIPLIKVDGVRQDPKFFEMVITDGEKKVYCRSIWAAEMSIKMIPHFRFIITDRN